MSFKVQNSVLVNFLLYMYSGQSSNMPDSDLFPLTSAVDNVRQGLSLTDPFPHHVGMTFSFLRYLQGP